MNNKFLAVVLLAVGLVLLFFAYQVSASVSYQVTDAMASRVTNSTTSFLILGVTSAVAGIGLLLFGKPEVTH